MRLTFLFLALTPLAACGTGTNSGSSTGTTTSRVTSTTTYEPSTLPHADATGSLWVVSGADFPVLSADGCCLLYGLWGDTPGYFVHERGASASELVSVGSDRSIPEGGASMLGAAISADGQLVAFISDQALVADDTNHSPDVYVRDRGKGETTRVSVMSDGSQPAGRRGGATAVAMSGDGSLVAFATYEPMVADDTNSTADVYVHDRSTGETTRISTGPNGAQGDGDAGELSMSEDGRYVAFSSRAANLTVDAGVRGNECAFMNCVYVHDRADRQTKLLAASASWPVISGDGSRVVMTRYRESGMAGAEDIVVIDRVTGEEIVVAPVTEQLMSDELNPGWAENGPPAISRDGRFVAFWSQVADLVPGDTNGRRDVFVRDLETGGTRRVSLAPDGTQIGGEDLMPMATRLAMSGDGAVIAYLADSLPGQMWTSVAVIGW